ncbi:MAG TPA: response regulator [Steroidobacteraceae bacterium]|jgi:CheY-like chemotaxis protein
MAHILLVDDDESVRRSLARLLRAYDYEVLEAENAAVALRVLETTRPALMLLDIIMPSHNSLETARRIKAEPGTASLPIVALTASPPAALSDRVLFTAIMSKPCDPRFLLETIERALADR